MSELSIKIRIGNREYPMKVKVEDEEAIRKAGKLINDKIKSYEQQFGIDDKQDLLAMVAFDLLIEIMRSSEQSEHSDEFAIDRINHINRLISNTL